MTIFDSYGVPNGGPRFAIVSICMFSLACLFVIFRIAGRFTRTTSHLGWDDSCIVAALLCCMIDTVLGLEAVSYGFGRHGADLTIDQQRNALMYFYAYQIVYKLLINFTKLSFLVLYLRIFPNTQEAGRLRLVAWLMIWACTIGSIAFFLVTIFQCTPIPRAWDKTIAGTCINNTAFWYSHASFNTVTDMIIYLMPIYNIAKMRLPTSSKVGLILIFATGAFVLFTSIMRMTTLDSSAKARDHTWVSMSALLWTEIEANTGVIVACLPTLRAPIMDSYHSLFPSRKTPPGSKRSNHSALVTIGSRRPKAAYVSTWDAEAEGDDHSLERIVKTTDINVDVASSRASDGEADFSGRVSRGTEGSARSG